MHSLRSSLFKYSREPKYSNNSIEASLVSVFVKFNESLAKITLNKTNFEKLWKEFIPKYGPKRNKKQLNIKLNSCINPQAKSK